MRVNSMRKIMVCVTEQKTCDRLIMFGHDLMLSKNDELYIIHISRSENFLNISKAGDALEYLYEKALEYGANLTVLKSENVLDSMVGFIDKNRITHVVLGQSGETQKENNIVYGLTKIMGDKVKIAEVPTFRPSE